LLRLSLIAAANAAAARRRQPPRCKDVAKTPARLGSTTFALAE